MLAFNKEQDAATHLGSREPLILFQLDKPDDHAYSYIIDEPRGKLVEWHRFLNAADPTMSTLFKFKHNKFNKIIVVFIILLSIFFQ